jgi:hypothetical protein
MGNANEASVDRRGKRIAVSVCADHLKFAEEMVRPVYGPYMGGGPRNFEPDPECSTEEQRERQLKAREAWERGQRWFAIGFGMEATHDKLQDECCRRNRQLIEEYRN